VGVGGRERKRVLAYMWRRRRRRGDGAEEVL
jgi:hypothetical protein